MPHPLYAEYQLNTLSLKNRIVMAPMTRCRAGAGDVPTALMATYYAQRATAGLIISEGVPVSPMARGYLWTPGIYTPEQVAGWRNVADAVHANGGKMFIQIWHVGRISHKSLLPEGAAPEAPSVQPSQAQCFAYDDNGNPGYVNTSTPDAMTAEAINRVKAEFVQAAKNAVKAGMDGVEIHGANGYLFDQFLNSLINTRDDNYGGNAENRCRFLLEVVDAVSAAIGADRTAVRISPYGRFNDMPDDPELIPTFSFLCAELSRRNIAFLHVNDQGTFGLPEIPEEVMRLLRESYAKPLMLCGGYNAERAEAAIDSDLADLVAFGVSYLANPDLPARLENRWTLNEANPDTFYGGGEAGYTDYPVHA
jgi:N-ethylmaleimide reductase